MVEYSGKRVQKPESGVKGGLLMRVSSRRDFLKRATLIASGYWVSGIPARAVNRSPNEKLNIGIIGIHNRGAANLKGVSGENIVALCDVDDNYLAEAKNHFPKAKTFN